MSDIAPKRIAVIGSPGRIDGALRKPIPELMKRVSHNTGNLASWYAIDRHVAAKKTYFGWDFDPEQIRNEFDVVIFAESIQLNPDWDLGNLARRLEATQKPLVVLGLGVQLDDFDEPPQLSPGTQRLISLFGERCVRVGMLGDFSASVAVKYGARNVEVIGCPSNFINTWHTDLGVRIARRLVGTRKPYRLAVNLDLNLQLATTIRRCVSWLQEWGGYLVVQTSISPIHLALGQADRVPPEELRYLSNLLFDGEWDESIRQFLSSQLAVFFDAEAWMSAIRPSRLSIGTRLQGNILAFQAGVPSIVITHDSRTKELADTIAFPTVTEYEILEAKSLPDLISGIEFDGAAYDLRRRALARRYIDILTASDLPVSADILSFALKTESTARLLAPAE